jgi:hypothetical protein
MILSYSIEEQPKTSLLDFWILSLDLIQNPSGVKDENFILRCRYNPQVEVPSWLITTR